ncbi:MAG TPA: hypothetical protein VIS07_14735 [Candidatus Binatia bacterium]
MPITRHHQAPHRARSPRQRTALLAVPADYGKGSFVVTVATGPHGSVTHDSLRDGGPVAFFDALARQLEGLAR